LLPGTIGSVDGDGSPYAAVVVDTTAVIISAFFDIRLLSWTTRSPAVADKRWVGCRSSCPLLRGPCFCSRRCCSHGLFLASSRQQAELLLAVVIIASCWSRCRRVISATRAMPSHGRPTDELGEPADLLGQTCTHDVLVCYLS
jgi:hypothetical protein